MRTLIARSLLILTLLAFPAVALATETDCADGRDNDGDGLVDCADRDCYHDPACGGTPIDADGDGFDSTVDCDDTDPTIYPGAPEVVDGLDNDCDGLVDEGTSPSEVDCADGVDNDKDGWVDCLDSDCFTDPACAAPGETDCTDGRDNDGDGYVDCADRDCYHDPACGGTGTDADGDGFDNTVDCDDRDPTVFPGAPETCDGVDNDCDGMVDEGCHAPTDADGDGFDDVAYGGTDCDDRDATVYPGAPETCDGVDNNCDGVIDEGCGGTGTDADRDGFDDSVDCDDGDASIFPGADEYCDGADNDCDGQIDESDAVDASAWYPDNDADGFGSASAPGQLACEQPTGMVADNSDCDDNQATVHPGSPEICDDGLDNDCDGLRDDDDDDCEDTGQPEDTAPPEDTDPPSDSDSPVDTGEPKDDEPGSRCNAVGGSASLVLLMPLALLGLRRRRG